MGIVFSLIGFRRALMTFSFLLTVLILIDLTEAGFDFLLSLGLLGCLPEVLQKFNLKFGTPFNQFCPT